MPQEVRFMLGHNPEFVKQNEELKEMLEEIKGEGYTAEQFMKFHVYKKLFQNTKIVIQLRAHEIVSL